MLQEINSLFNEYDTNTICVTDFNIVVRGTRVDNIHQNDDGSISIYAGNIDNDKFAEELLLDKSERDYVFEEILDNI